MSDFHANRTLGDIEDYDLDNLKYILQNVKEMKFTELNQVTEFSGLCMNAALQKHDINLNVAIQMSNDPEYEDVGAAIDTLMKAKNVRVEERMNYDGEDRWRCGFYIYKNNEITDFIGAPYKEDAVLTFKGFVYVVKTTVKL